MAQYDGSIRINTQINTKSAEINLSTVENRIVKTADKIASLRSKMDSLKDTKIPTQEYSALTEELNKQIEKLKEIDAYKKEYSEKGLLNENQLKAVNWEIEHAEQKIKSIAEEMNRLDAAGKAFTLGSETEEFAKLGQQLRYAENDLSVLNQKHEVLGLKLEKTKEGYKRLGSIAKSAFSSVGKGLTKANSYVNSFGKRIRNIAQKILPSFHKETKKTNTVLGHFSTRLKSLLSGMFIFNVISSNIRKMFSGINESFENFYNQNAAFRSSVDNMRVSLLQLKNSLAAAFAPIVSVAIPYLEKLIAYVTKAINSVGQLIAALLGKKTYTKAIRTSVGGLEDTKDAFEEVEESAKDAEKAVKGYLNPLDEINPYSNGEEVKIDIDTGKKPDSSDIGDTIEDMFEEVPIDSYFLDLAGKIKDIFSKIFAPLKEAWNREGKFVMDSWKYALDEVWDLIKSIGSDFLEVWQQEKTIKIFEDLLHIIGDIGLIIGNLAHNFRLAWEENETGKRILEGIRDIIGVIVANIRHAADVTVEWAKNLNFGPLLTAIKGWIESLVPVFDNLSGIITDFYEKVLLPLGKWVLEKGLPDLLQVFIDFNNKVDWEALRSRLAQFWEHLEPFAETVGEGLIIFIGRLADALANFINSPEFEKFLTTIENWMDSVSPEDVADGLEKIAKAIVGFKLASAGFSVISKGIGILSNFFNILKLFGAGGGISGAVGVLKSIGTTIAGWAPHIAVGVAIVDVIKRIKDAVSERIDTGGFGLTDWISETLKLALEGWKQEFENWKISLELWWQDTWMSDAIWKFGQWWNEKISPWFTQEKWSELWKNISDSLSSKWQEIVDSWNITKEKLDSKWNEIKSSAIQIFDSMKKSLSDLWTETKQTAIQTWENIKQNLSEKWENIKSGAKTTFENIGKSIKESWTNIKTNVKESAENVKTNIANAWTKAKENTSATWNNIKEKAVTSAQSMAASVREKFSILQGAFSTFSSSAQNIWSNAWEGMRSKVSSILSSIQSTISSVFSWISSTIGSLGNSLRNLVSGVFSFGSSKSSFSGRTSSSFSRMSMPTSLYSSPAFAALKDVEIPGYATGQVIPRTMRQHLAILGDNNRETEVVSPLSTIEQAVKNALNGNGGGKEITIKVPVYLDGKQIYEAVIKQGKINQMSTGNNGFMLGTT